MNKLLLTCFLALLCLVGRYFTPSSKVADSPGAELLHRSDSPNRGGAILSDTFRYSVAPLQDNPTVVELDNRAIIQAPFSPLRGAGGTNGHPATHRSSVIQHPTTLPAPQFSLELSGEEGFKLSPHSRGLSTVDCGPNLPSSSIGHPTAVELDNRAITQAPFSPLRGAGGTNGHPTTHRSSVIGHPTTLPTPQLSLELSGDEGSKLAPHDRGPLTVDRGPNLPSSLPQPGILYLELASSTSVDSLYFKFWDHLVSERNTVTPGNSHYVSASPGNMFEGNRNYSVFTTELPQVSKFGYFSIGNGKNAIAKHWAYFPNDRLRIRVDLISGGLIFGGPNADFYRLQHEVSLAFKTQQFNADPVIFSANRNFLQDSLTAVLWEKAQAQPKDLYVRMKVISSAEEAWAEFEQYISSAWLDHPASRILDHYSQSLSHDRLDLVEAGIKGQILSMGMEKADLAWTAIQSDPAKFQKVKDWVDGFYLNELSHSHPLLAQSVYKWKIMEAKALQQPIQLLVQTLPNPLREEIIAFYILDNFNRMDGHLSDIIAKNLPLVASPWIQERFQNLLALSQDKFQPEGARTPDGNTLDPELIKGKTLLIHFWISGCKFCLFEHQNTMTKLSESFADHPDIRIITVNADEQEESWKKSLQSGKYTSESSLNLWVPKGTGLLKTYGIHSYPQKMIIGPDGKVKLQSINRMEVDELANRLETLSNSSTSFPPNP